jgi:hypothetical protein
VIFGDNGNSIMILQHTTIEKNPVVGIYKKMVVGDGG